MRVSVSGWEENSFWAAEAWAPEPPATFCSFSTNSGTLANYEGMCLGPTLPDGSRCLVLVPDSQGGQNGLTKEYVKVITVRP